MEGALYSLLLPRLALRQVNAHVHSWGHTTAAAQHRLGTVSAAGALRTWTPLLDHPSSHPA